MIKKLFPAVGWFIISLILLCLPGSTIPKHPWLDAIYADKWVHIFMFGVLCFLFCYPVRVSSLSINTKKKWFLYILLNGIAYGTIMEFVQKYWIPNRSFDIWDIMADGCGCLLGVAVSWKMMIKKETNSHN